MNNFFLANSVLQRGLSATESYGVEETFDSRNLKHNEIRQNANR